MAQFSTLILLFLFSFSASAQLAAPICKAFFAPVPAVFGYLGHESWGQQIFRRELQEMKASLAPLREQPWSQAKQTLITNDARKYFFHVRILSKTYTNLDDKFFDAQKDRFKEIERLLGHVKLLQDVQTMATSINEPSFLPYLQKQEKKTSEDLKKALEELGALDKTGAKFDALAEKLINYKHWPEAKSDRKYLIGDTIKELQELNKEVLRNEFDSEDIAKGLHKLRRSLREVLFRVANLENLATIVDEGPLPHPAEDWFNELKQKNPSIFTSPYMPESRPEVKNPIVLPKKLLAMITEIVLEIGSTKDQQEPALFLMGILKEIPHLDKEAERNLSHKLRALLKDQEGHRQVANALQARLRSSRLLEVFVEFLKRYN
jgi:hypothetical protein